MMKKGLFRALRQAIVRYAGVGILVLGRRQLGMQREPRFRGQGMGAKIRFLLFLGARSKAVSRLDSRVRCWVQEGKISTAALPAHTTQVSSKLRDWVMEIGRQVSLHTRACTVSGRRCGLLDHDPTMQRTSGDEGLLINTNTLLTFKRKPKGRGGSAVILRNTPYSVELVKKPLSCLLARQPVPTLRIAVSTY